MDDVTGTVDFTALGDIDTGARLSPGVAGDHPATEIRSVAVRGPSEPVLVHVVRVR